MVIGPDFVFIAVPRTASFWMSKRLLPLLGGVYVTPHHSVVVPEQHRAKFTFAVVRNPYDRMLSMYYHLRAKDRAHGIRNMSFPEFMDFVTKHWGEGAWPQARFLSRTRIDAVVRYEQMRKQLAELPFIAARYSVQEFIDGPYTAARAAKMNASNRSRPWWEDAAPYLSIINKHSKIDFETYKYARMEPL